MVFLFHVPGVSPKGEGKRHRNRAVSFPMGVCPYCLKFLLLMSLTAVVGRSSHIWGVLSITQFPLHQAAARSPGRLCSGSTSLPFLHGISAAKSFPKGSASWNTVLIDGKKKLTGQYCSIWLCSEYKEQNTHSHAILWLGSLPAKWQH